MTGRQNLRFTGRLNGLQGEELEKRIDEMLKRVGMTNAADRKTGTYSRGMKQRLGIADVLMKDPQIIIMDEPRSESILRACGSFSPLSGSCRKKIKEPY